MIKKAYVEITNVCNLACPFCPGTTRPKRFMTEDEFSIVLQKLAGKAQYLFFHVMGEPLLHPLLGRFLDIAGSAGFPVNITTNGTLLKEKGGSLLEKPALRQIAISLHSRVDDEDDGYLDNVLSFARQAAAAGKLVSLRLWNGQGGEAPGSGGMLRRLADEFGLTCDELLQWQDNRGRKLANGVFLNRADRFEWPDREKQTARSQSGFCMALRDQVGILCDGAVVPCCLDSEGTLALGNLFSEELDAILALPAACRIREGFSRRRAVEELCQTCGFRQRFDG